MLLSVPMFVGCDREMKHEERTTTNSDGTTTHSETTQKQTPNGDIVTEHKKTVDDTK